MQVLSFRHGSQTLAIDQMGLNGTSLLSIQFNHGLDKPVPLAINSLLIGQLVRHGVEALVPRAVEGCESVLQACLCHTEMSGETGSGHGWLALLLQSLTETSSSHGQIPQSPGDAQHGRTIPPVVHDLAVRTADQVRAWLQSPTCIKAFNPGDQAETGLLEQIVEVLRSLLLLTLGDQMGESEVLKNLLVAMPYGIGHWSALLMALTMVVDQKENASASSGFPASGRQHAHPGVAVAHSGA